jgi:hypothetical protein
MFTRTDSQHAALFERQTLRNPDLKATFMPQKSSRAVRSSSASSQANVRSMKTHSERSTRKSRKSRRKAAKSRRSYLPETKVLRIQKRYISGENKSEIARQEGCDRETVARIVKFPEVQNLITEMQQEFYGLVPDAMVALRHALQVNMDPNVGFRVLEGTGVAPHKHERLQIPATQAETGLERQARMLADVLLVSAQNFGVDLGKDIKDVLAKDAESHEAKTSERKSLKK